MFFRFVCVTVLFCVASAAAAQPIVIAHRGASGYLPEHTLEAYAMAYAMGADYIEPDLVMTKDKRLICLHDINLEGTTDVEQKFPGRKRADGKWYAADFTIAEIKQLAAEERLENRFPQQSKGFHVPTFEEMIELVQGLNKAFDKNIGIYPELKAPAWHASQNLPMEQAALDVLAKYGYAGPDARVFVQCFEAEPLQKIRHELGSTLPLIQLVGNGNGGVRALSAEGLDEIASYANGIGPDRMLIQRDPDIVKRAHARKLAVHPYTFRADDFNRRDYASFDDELRHFLAEFKIDGFFTDQPDRGLQVVQRTSQTE